MSPQALIAIRQPDQFWKQVYLSGERNPIYFRAEVDDGDIVIALAERGVDVSPYADSYGRSLS